MNFPNDEIFFDASQSIDEDRAVKMVHLVLKSPRQKVAPLDGALRAASVEASNDRARRANDRLMTRLRSMEDRLDVVNEVRGRGLLIAVGFTRDCASDVVDACRRRGLLANNVRPNAVRLMPPLNVSDDEIDRACDILEEAIVAATTTVAK